MRRKMTLDQYNNQKDPKYMPNVWLQEGEYTLGSSGWYYAGGAIKEHHQQIWVNGFPYEYCLIGCWLYTTDRDGNPKQSSCFHLNLEA